MARRHFIIILMAVLGCMCATPAGARINMDRLALDSVAEWGRFPRFCIDVYRWGDKFFNSYDSAYVVGTGYKFNGKVKVDTWVDNYMFQLPDGYHMNMVSNWDTSVGPYLTYLAVTAGYDLNASRLWGGPARTRKRFIFNFNCALFSANLYWITNKIGTRITEYGYSGNRVKCSIPFDGIDTSIFGLDAYYFLNNKRYSAAAAFNFSKIQRRSQGSWFFGGSYWTQNFWFDFNKLPKESQSILPPQWANNGNIFAIKNHNYAFRAGYAYTWVLPRNVIIGVSESPVIGLKRGTVNGGRERYSVSLYNRAKASVVWNNGRWFAGIVGTAENGFYFDRSQSLLNGYFTAEATAGCRFNLW